MMDRYHIKSLNSPSISMIIDFISFLSLWSIHVGQVGMTSVSEKERNINIKIQTKSYIPDVAVCTLDQWFEC